jgi:RNA polymerase sigma-70 factor (ECF subfamily)
MEGEQDRARQRRVVEAFLAAVRGGDLGALLAVLDPDVVLRADAGALPEVSLFQGAGTVADQALAFSARAAYAQRAWVNGSAGLLVASRGRPVAVLAFTIAGDRVVEIYIYADPERLNRYLAPRT